MSTMANVPVLTNSLSLLICCPSDKTLMLTIDNVNSDHWLPTVSVQENANWIRVVSKEVQEILGIKPAVELIRLSKIWYPQITGSIQLMHGVFQVPIDINVKNKSKISIGKYRGKIKWVTGTDLSELSKDNNLRSPDILELYHLCNGINIFTIERAEDIVVMGNMVEITNEILVSGKMSNYQQLVDSSNIDKLAQESIYCNIYLRFCYPANYMSLRAFSKFITNLGWTKAQVPFLFKAADHYNRFAISFRELLYILAAIDPATAHGGAAAELRCKYMFRYYDRDNDGLLNSTELKNIISDLRKSKKLAIDPPNVARELQDIYKTLGMQEGQGLGLNEFLKAVCDLKLRGTSYIFRSTVGIIKYLNDQEQKSAGSSQQIPVVGSKQSAMIRNVSLDNPRGKMTIKNADYEVAVHTVKIQRSGQRINIEEMKEIQEAVSATTIKQPTNEYNQRLSMDVFSQRSIPNEVLKGIRYLASINNLKSIKVSYTWGELDSTIFARNLIQVCIQVRDIFKTEPRLLQLTSPVYIMGDLHGNIADLLYFEKTLWHIGPGLSPCNLLFLGDYVDRGSYSIEVIGYLLSYKLQSPNKMSLLRGNHEIRDVQKMFTFYKECCLKLGEKLGNELWNAVNNAFDTMPLAATIDGKVFCCHGGCPPPWLCPGIAAINDIPAVLNQPDSQSSLAWELMWNDPVRPTTTSDKVMMELMANEGFAVNVRRGTAHVFSVEALERFLRVNQLTHLVRAHEVAQAGFQVLQKGRLLTVFSSSKYCGGFNDAACIMADQGKLRMLRLETE